MIRSPLFYVGDKYKLVPQLKELFPNNISDYVEPFYGGGSSQLQINAYRYYLNDIDENIIGLHRLLLSYANNQEEFFEMIFKIIKEYNLSCSLKDDVIPLDLKKSFPKTYYSRYNKSSYSRLRDDYNRKEDKDYLKLYLLLIYGFNHMIRFNSNNQFNLPVGNVDFNKNVYEALINYFDLQKNRDIVLSSMDFEKFLTSLNLGHNSFVYLDPPYLISMSEYNKLWTEETELRLYALLDSLNNKGIRFGITNLAYHKGKTNDIFLDWSKKYPAVRIDSNYISFNDNTIKKDSVELYVCNYWGRYNHVNGKAW